MGRRRFTERQVLKVLLAQGATILCFRCKEPFFNGADDEQIEREHLQELALGGEDAPVNCVYSHKACHARITNGTPSTTAGSSKHRIAKTRGNRAAKFAVRKLRLDKKRDPKPRYGNTTFRSTPR